MSTWDDESVGWVEPCTWQSSERTEPSSLKDLLRGPPSRALRRIFEGDPLQVEANCAARMQETGYLLDVEDVTLRAMARIAHAGMSWSGSPPIDLWMRERIDVSLEDIARSDRERLYGGERPTPPYEPRFMLLAERLGLSPSEGLAACVRFHALETRVRVNFFGVVVLGKRINRWVAEGHGPPEVVQQDVGTALRALSAHDDLTGPGPLP